MSTPDLAIEQELAGKRVGLLLAAGRGTRFDPTGRASKLLADLRGLPVAVHAARALRRAGLPVLAVVRPGACELAQRLAQEGCEVTHCPLADRGMGESLAHGARMAAQHGAAALVVALADMPFLDPAIIERVARRVGPADPVVAAGYAGQRGHPVAFDRSMFGALSGLGGDRGAGQLFAHWPPLVLETEDPAVLRDIDRPADLGDQRDADA
ncbi:MAG: nucleotidyltransferase family protein [Burkholderiaceae bacterium]